MYFNLNKNIRIVYYPVNSKSTYLLIDNRKNQEFEINNAALSIIKSINNSLECGTNLLFEINQLTKIKFNYIKDYIEILLQKNIIESSIHKSINLNILEPFKKRKPLHSVALEVTQKCNLRCIHCYGAYNNLKENFISLDYIKILCNQFNILNTYQINLTGGEYFLHPNYNEIFNLFKTQGYQIAILTNGLYSEKIMKFLDGQDDIYFDLKISLDGLDEVHNKIRGNNNSFYNVIKLLNYLKNKINIKVTISITINKLNIFNIKKLIIYIKEKYPFNYTIDLAYNTVSNDMNKDLFFNMNELHTINEIIPEYYQNMKGIKVKINRNSHRCNGGIYSAAISADYYLKLCIGAFGNDFIFGNLKEKNLVELWENPPKNIQYFRKEKLKDLKKCKKCIHKNYCLTINCRLLAKTYTGDCKQPNPLICYSKYCENERIN